MSNPLKDWLFEVYKEGMKIGLIGRKIPAKHSFDQYTGSPAYQFCQDEFEKEFIPKQQEHTTIVDALVWFLENDYITPGRDWHGTEEMATAFLVLRDRGEL